MSILFSYCECLPLLCIDSQQVDNNFIEDELHNTPPQSLRSRQREIEKLKQRLLELDLKELERLRNETPFVQPQTIWAKRVCDQRKQAQQLITKGTNPPTVVQEEEVEDTEEEAGVDAETAADETADMEVVGSYQESQVSQTNQASQSEGIAMEQRLVFFSQQMTARHKPTTTRQYSQHWAAWQVSFPFTPTLMRTLCISKINTYQIYQCLTPFLPFQTFCEALYNGDDEVSSIKAALFLTKNVFGRTRHIVLNSNLKSFDGVIGLTVADPQRDRAAHEQEVRIIEENFEAGTSIYLSRPSIIQ